MNRTNWRNEKWWKRFLQETSGAEIAEAAVVLPLLFMLLFGIMWFARAFNIYSTVNRAAREGALAAARPTSATAPTSNNFSTQADVITFVNPILAASHLDPSQAVITLQDVPLYPGSPLVDRVVEVDYPYNFPLNGVTCCPLTLSPIIPNIVLKGKAQAQKED